MIKRYTNAEHTGSSKDYWKGVFSQESIETVLRSCSLEPLYYLMNKYFAPESVVVDAGCGLGQHVIFYKNIVKKIIGLDFSLELMKGAKSKFQDALFCTGDIRCLPILSHSIDIYFSNGVIEHYEAGPFDALLEAHRVLKNNGILIVTVPNDNFLRRIHYYNTTVIRDKREVNTALIRCKRFEVETNPPFPRLKFNEYFFSKRELAKILNECGFTLMKSCAYNIVWGLADFQWIKRRFTRTSKEQKESTTIGKSTPPSFLKRLFISEGRMLSFPGYVVDILSYLFGHMRVYVCVKC